MHERIHPSDLKALSSCDSLESIPRLFLLLQLEKWCLKSTKISTKPKLI